MRFTLIVLFIVFAMLQAHFGGHEDAKEAFGTEAQASPALLTAPASQAGGTVSR